MLPPVTVPAGLMRVVEWVADTSHISTGEGALWLATVRDAAGRAALILQREYLVGELARSRERELLNNLLSGDPSLRAEAVDGLVAEDLLLPGRVTALVATLSHEPDQPLPEQDRLALTAAVDHGRRRLAPRNALTLQRTDHALLVIAWSGTSDDNVEQVTRTLATSIQQVPVREGSNTECWVGIGGTHPRLIELRQSYHEALRAATVARITGAFGPVAPYGGLGVYALLAQLPHDRSVLELVPARADRDVEAIQRGPVIDRRPIVSDVVDTSDTAWLLRHTKTREAPRGVLAVGRIPDGEAPVPVALSLINLGSERAVVEFLHAGAGPVRMARCPCAL